MLIEGGGPSAIAREEEELLIRGSEMGGSTRFIIDCANGLGSQLLAEGAEGSCGREDIEFCIEFCAYIELIKCYNFRRYAKWK